LAGVIRLYEPSTAPVGILAEGTFFWGDPAYAARVDSTLRRLLPASYTATILRTDEANLIGSAVAALEP
jgi:hexokinase